MVSNTSQSGPSWRGRHPDLWYFDRLPPTARAALANAAFDWSSGWIFSGWQRGKPGFRTGPDIAATLAEADAHQIAMDRKRVWRIAE
jgi:hypothetical protein